MIWFLNFFIILTIFYILFNYYRPPQEDYERTHYGDHFGHIVVLPSLLCIQINLLSPEEKELAKNCAHLNFTASASTALLNIRDALGMGIEWNDRQVSYFNKKQEGAYKNLSSNASTAELLVESMKNRPEVSYLYVTFSPLDGLLLLTAKERKQYKKRKDDSDLLNLFNAHKLGSTGKLLLIFLYASNEELRLVRMHPEFVSCDKMSFCQFRKF